MRVLVGAGIAGHSAGERGGNDMRRVMTAAMLAGGLMIAGPASADPPQQTPPTTTATSDSGTTQTPPQRPRRPRRHCEEVVNVGSIMPSRVCISEEEWQARQAAQQATQQHTSDVVSSCMRADTPGAC